MTKLALEFASRQHVGTRENQQDAFLVCEFNNQDRKVFLLADGMGGHVAGEVAATRAIDAFAREMKTLDAPAHLSFDRLLDKANRSIAQEIRNNPGCNGMGCTFVALEIIAGQYSWISIGDSPLFLSENAKAKRLNADHSMASRLDAAAQAGEISWEDARSSKSRNALLHALVGTPITRMDWQRQAKLLATGEWLVLASDGLETLSRNEIASLISKNASLGVDIVADALLSAVLEKDNPLQDNVSFFVIRLAQGTNNDSDQITTRAIKARA